MKKLINFAIGAACFCGVSHGATVVISAGLGGTNIQGVSLKVGETTLASTEFYVGVGRYDLLTGSFSPWQTLALDTATGSPSNEVSGSFTSVTSAAFNGLGIQVFVGALDSASATATPFTPSGKKWAVFSSTTNPLFPTSSGSSSQTFNMTTQATLGVVATGDPSNNWGTSSTTSGSAGNHFVLVPEPSAALLGAIGALGLLRRRRN